MGFFLNKLHNLQSVMNVLNSKQCVHMFLDFSLTDYRFLFIPVKNLTTRSKRDFLKNDSL